jgi:hypothetical protein
MTQPTFQLDLYGKSTFAVGETVLTPLGQKTILSFKSEGKQSTVFYKVDVNGRSVWVGEGSIQRVKIKSSKKRRKSVPLTKEQKTASSQLTLFPLKPQTEFVKNKFIDSIRQSLIAVRQAYSQKDDELLKDAKDAYALHYRRARRNGITEESIRTKCKSAYLDCVAWNLNKSIKAVTDGNPMAVLKHMAWMEADRQRAIDAGFPLKEINAKPPKLTCGTTK